MPAVYSLQGVKKNIFTRKFVLAAQSLQVERKGRYYNES